MISFEEFKRLDLRVGQILSAESVPESDRLFKIQVDLGSEQRTLVAGIAKYYSPEDLIGLKVVVAANLEPAVIRGIESQGMILAADGSSESEVGLLTVNKEVTNGTRVE